MKKVLSIILVLCMMASLFACTAKEEETKKPETSAPSSSSSSSSSESTTKTPDTTVSTQSNTTTTNVAAETNTDKIKELTNGQLVDGKFPKTVDITVEIFNRDGNLDCTNNMYTDFIKKGVLDKYNINVTFVAVPRWTEVEQINNLLAAGTAPDICYSYNWDTVASYGAMGGVVDMQEWIKEEYKGLFPNLWSWLGEDGLKYHQDPADGTIWAIEARRAEPWKSNTFVRADWLAKLNLAAPTNVDEFEAMLKAFKDNAKLLLGDNADKMVPFSIGSDVGWRSSLLIESMMSPDITDYELYIYGSDDRNFLQSTTKDAVKILNKWYNEGLIWQDFALYASGDSTEDDMIKAGYVGAFIHNYDYPFREDGINLNLSKLVGDSAKFVAIDAFKDSKGNNTKYAYTTIGSDRKIFFPYTNKNSLATLLYLDWITDPANVEYLQIGEEGITHEVLPGGAIKTMTADEAHIMTHEIKSLYNIDYTMTTNGLRLATEELTNLSKAYGYGGIDPQDIINAIAVATHDARTTRHANTRSIAAEAEAGSSLTEIRDSALCNAVVCKPADFDKTWTQGMNQYLSAGAQDIIDERKEAWSEAYGTAKMIP